MARRTPDYTVAGSPEETESGGSWMPTPNRPDVPVDSGNFNIGTPYNPGNNSGVNGGNNPSTVNWNLAPTNNGIGTWPFPSAGLGGVSGIGGPTSSTPSNSSAFGATSQWGNGDTITQFFRSRGLTDDAQLQRLQRDWTGWWNAWGSRDPEYFWRRIQQENDLIGGPQNSEFGGSGGGREFTDPWGSTLESLVSQFLQGSTGRATHLAETYRSRAKELRDTPAYTAQDEAAIQARAYDQLERRRAETLKNSREAVYARGFAPTSGIVNDRANNVNTQFEQARTGIASDILRAQLDETNRRKDAAIQLEALATEALNGGDLAAIQATGLPLQLMNTRENNALNVFNSSSGNGISGILSTILNAASGNQQNGQNNANNNAAGYGGLINLIMNSLFPSGR